MDIPDEVSGRPARSVGFGGLDTTLARMLGAAMLVAATTGVWVSLGRMMTLDELYTTTLIETPSLVHMVEGAVRGVDGNPPLYLSLAWVLTHALPFSEDCILRGFNLAVMGATTLMLASIGRRIADPLSVVIALSLLCAVDGSVVYALLEVRTYALYLCLGTATLWATLAVVDRPSTGRVIGLAVIGVLTAVTHSLGGLYAMSTILSGALVCWVGGDQRRALRLSLAGLPALAVTLTWIRIFVPMQLLIASPYGWIPRPTFIGLIETLTGSVGLTLLGLLAIAWLATRGEVIPRLTAWREIVALRDRALLIAVPVSYGALTTAAWIGSQAITPFFLDRYFIPNLIVGGLILFLAVATARRLAPPRLFAAGAAFCSLAGLATVALGHGPVANVTPCLTAEGSFLEDSMAGDLPVVIESPLGWLPRTRYAPGRTTLYPLDWGVVLNHPYRARNNAMDFHIMEILKDWAPSGSALATRLLPTANLLAQYPKFLLLDELNRGWLRDLRAETPLSATLLSQVPGCRLWQIDVSPQR